MATRTTTRKSAPKTTRKPAAKAQPEPQRTTDENPKLAELKADAEQDRSGMSPAQRKALASKIIALRAKGTRWDGVGGVCDQTGIRTALVGRALMREFGAGNAIKPLSGLRAPQAS